MFFCKASEEEKDGFWMREDQSVNLDIFYQRHYYIQTDPHKFNSDASREPLKTVGDDLVKNPYFELHKEFNADGTHVLMSSGQACILYGIATFSKDGDWIIRETKESCLRILDVLAKKKACYRLGAPLDILWLSQGLTTHFEYFLDDGYRMRIDFCSRPPRVQDIKKLWENAGRKGDVDFIDIESLISLKQTRRVRDYNIIGTLAEVIGFNQSCADIALRYLQDYNLLNKAVKKWPGQAKKCNRKAVQAIVKNKPRSDVVACLALEQDEKMQQDEKRIKFLKDRSKVYQKKFVQLRKNWLKKNYSLKQQHNELVSIARELL